MDDNVERRQMFIDGGWAEAADGRYLSSIDPYSQRVWLEVPEAGSEDVDRAVRAAHRALTGPWRTMPGTARAKLMHRLADLLEEHGDELARAEVRDNGKPIHEMAAQLAAVPDWYRYFAGAADKLGGEVIDSAKTNFFVYTLAEPVGVVALITAWNSPSLILAYKLAPALAAGCTVVVKPPEQAPASALIFAELVERAGFPAGVVNIITGDGPGAGASLVRHPLVNKVSLTGATATGIHVARLAADHLARVSLELGGKAPNIVFADCDLDAAVNGAVSGIFAAAGQSCVAGARLLVERSVHDRLVESIVERAGQIRLGDPMDPETDGPLAYAEHQRNVLGHIDAARAEGAFVACGGSAVDGTLFVRPTVLTAVTPQMTVAREEIFGPVLAVIAFDSEEEAIAIANDTPYGLAAGLWTRDLRRAHRVARALHAGTIWVNDFRVENFDVPFGGMKMSGYGRENGLAALRDYQQTKAVWIELDGNVRDPFIIG